MTDKILFISLYEPSKAGERIGGAVILANDILSVTNPDLNVDLIVYKKEKIMSELPEHINFVSWSKLANRTKKETFWVCFPKICITISLVIQLMYRHIIKLYTIRILLRFSS